MARTSQTLSSNVSLLKSKASKHAIFGVIIALAAIGLATLGVAFMNGSEIGFDAVIRAQKENPALWLLDAMPFIFAFWGQYVSSIMAYEASAMVIDQTSELRTQTTILEQQAMRSATYDALTELPNRILLRDRLEQAILSASKKKRRLAVMIMDLDRFKEINDTLGHYNGDRLLKQVATRLQGVIQEPASVARLGGDEFAILLPRISEVKEVGSIVGKIHKALQSPFMLDTLKLDIQASIGAAIFPEHGADADTLLQRADVAMYVAKKNQSGFVVYASKYDEHSPHRLTLMGELRHAIENGHLVLHFQPKVNVKSNVVEGVEALVRWQHEQHGLMPPDEFIPLAERTGLIKPLTHWVLRQSLKQCAAWRLAGLNLCVAVNLSAQGLMDMELPDTVAGLLAANDVPADRLILEITESTIMLDKDRALQILTRLADMGVRLSIDDFGTGYSSLAYLSKMPVKEIKIDKSFVMDMENNKSNSVIVHATIELGHNLGLEVVGEGVENAGVLGILDRLNCDSVQGYHLLRPMAGAAFDDWMQQAKEKGEIRVEAGNICLTPSA
ncbi:MAG: EAL domain-containing protein [Hydrogenophilales bacterium]|nr:EAL domain-containing protein [Hydrogenophilales bacterium]